MKKILSFLLAVVMVVTALSGLTMAAPKTVEVNLRPGRTVDVADDVTFMQVYTSMFEPGSDINRIRLTDSFKVYTKGLRTPGGKDPWKSGAEDQLCVRMPEGTCLDLNGQTLAVRSSQGLDDNGTGTPSGQKHFGTVIDTFGGGMLNLYCFNDPANLQYALELAREHSDIVGMVSVSQDTPDCADMEFVVPAGIILRFSGKPAGLGAKKVTLEPGATIEKLYDQAPGFKNCKAVVWQYVDDADLNRAGKKFATETVKVSGTVPVREYVTYKINVEGGDQTVVAKGKPAITVPDVKVIATNKEATTEAAVIQNPSGVTFPAPRRLSYAEVQKLIQDICLVFHYMAVDEPYIQYDGKSTSALDAQNLQRKWDKAPPEWAAMDNTVFSVCSDYCWMVYYTAFEQQNLFKAWGPRTKTWADLNPDEHPGVVYQYTGPQAKNSKGETDLAKAYAESRKIVQPGDIICYANNDTGHALMYVGPIFKDFGDNTDYILHCRGSSYNTTTGQESRELAGECIQLMKADETVWGGDKVLWSLGRADSVAMGFVIMRPYLDPELPQLPTQSGMNRLLFPRMVINRELDRYKFDPAQTGDEVSVYVTITNKNHQEYTEVPVEEYIPAGTTYVEGSATKGAKIENGTIKWSVKIPAGKQIILTYKVKLNGKLGDTVDFKAGLVGGIASRPTTLQIGGVPLTNAQQTAIHDQALSLRGTKGGFQDLNFFNRLYADSLGVDIGLPKTTAELLQKLAHVKDGAVIRTGTDELDKMILPLHFVGQFFDPSGGNWARVREFKKEYYQPGDIFVCMGGNSTTTLKNVKDLDLMMYLGDGRVLRYTTEGVEVTTFSATMDYALKYNLMIALRPTQGIADLNKKAAKTMAFTDVTTDDWFYEFVREAYENGIVSGMTETTFAPKGNLTWGQALKLVTLAAGEKEQAGGTHWASGYLTLAKSKKWVTKDVDLNANITRKEFCQVAAKAKGLTQQPSYNPFTDTASKEVMALYNAGVINGMTESSFAPDALLTRAQIAKIIALLRAL